MLSNIGCFACAIIFVTGCNCEQKAQDMEDRANRFFAQRMKCCDELRDLGQSEAAAECYRQLADDIEQTGSDLLDWQIACENDDREAMDLILRILLARESSGVACDTPGILTKGDQKSTYRSPTLPRLSLEKIQSSSNWNRVGPRTETSWYPQLYKGTTRSTAACDPLRNNSPEHS